VALVNFLNTADLTALGLEALLAVFGIDVVLIGISVAQFRRNRLILD